MPSVWLNELTWEDVDSYLEQKQTIIIPCGTTEQHGPAGPLGLDTYVAMALAGDAAREAGVLSTPPLWFGDSSHHLGFAGTISLRTETLMAVVRDMLVSLTRHGFRKILLINGHKVANMPALTSAAKNFREYDRPDVLVAIADPTYLARGIAGKVKGTNEHHAGELEVSHVLYKFPDVIKKEKFSPAECDFPAVFGTYGTRDLFGSGGDSIEQPWTSAEQRLMAPTGQFSSNAGTATEKGKAYHDYMVGRLVEFLRWWEGYRGPLGSTHP